MNDMRWCYISGPMTGLKNFNIEAFDAYAAVLRAEGWHVYSPPELDGGDTTKPWKAYLRRDILLLAETALDAVFLLPGWEGSRGAVLEKHVADAMQIPTYDVKTRELIPARDWRLVQTIDIREVPA